MVVQTATVIINIVLAPALMFGWIGTAPMGVAGAGLASFVAIIVGTIWLAYYFFDAASYLKLHPHFRPNAGMWGQVLKIGLPAGVEFALIAVYLFVVYTVSRPFGAAAQAGFGIGQRIIQAGFMPVVALGFAVAPVAGQNFGARKAERVRETFKRAALMAAGIMALFTAPLPFCGRGDDPILLVGPARHRGRRRVSAPHRRGVPCVGRRVRERQHVSGDGQYDSAAHRLVHPHPRRRDSGVAALADAGVRARWIWYLSVAATMLQLAMNLLLLGGNSGSGWRSESTRVKFSLLSAHFRLASAQQPLQGTSLFASTYGNKF